VNKSNIQASGGVGQHHSQQSLFEAQPAKPRSLQNHAPIASHRDPVSSHLAAAEITASGLRDSQKRIILDWLRGRATALTSAEISRDAGLDRHMVARRLPDLERDGLVQRGAERTCTATGRRAITWRPVQHA
jgi:hypothetical protein